jgi:type IV secretion system protein VirB3
MATTDEPDVLFLACSRPAMAFGVPFEGFMLNFCGTFLLGLWLGSPLYWLVGIALHFPMRIVTALDHNFFRLGRLWLETKGASVRSDLWGGSSLAVLPAARPKTARELATSV